MPGAAVASSTVVVKGSDVGTPPGQHWALTSQTGSYTTGFVTGPGTPPLGTGSLRLTVSGTASHIALYNYDDGLFFPAPDVKLADIDAIGYSTYRDGASVTPNIVPSYNIEIDPDGPSGNASPDYASLVWDPSYNGGGVLDNTWQTWDAYNGGAGVWISTRTIPGVCAFSCPVAWSTIVAANPNATIKYGFGPNLGSGYSGVLTNVDNVQLGVSGNTTTYDFEPAACTTNCYVDAAHGDDNNGGSAPSDAKKTIQAGISAVSPSGTVHLAAGTYTENVVVNKAVTISGAGAATTKVRPAVSAPNPCAGSSLCGGAASSVFLAESANVTITGLAVNGDNPSLTSGVVVGGVDIDARNGIITNNQLGGTFDNLVVHDVNVNSVFLRGIYASNGGTFDFNHNKVTNVRGDSGSIGIFNFGGSGNMSNNTVWLTNDAISSNHSSGVTFLNNVITQSASGVHTDNAGDGGGTGDVIQGNSVSNCLPDGYGTWVFVPYIAPTVDNNTITGCAVGLADFGDGGNAVTTAFTNNTVDALHASGSTGAFVTTDQLGFAEADVKATFTSNKLQNADTGLEVDETNGKVATVALASNQITGNFVGVNNTGSTSVDARKNWWGNASGPSGWSIGSGDQVSANVQFFPWSTNAASTTFQACTITGTNAPETLNGTNGSDIICGKGGNDTINGLDGNDLLIGDGGDDTLVGGQGNDAILGTSGNDTLKGGAGLDSLQGGDGTDTCSDPNPFHFATCESGP